MKRLVWPSLRFTSRTTATFGVVCFCILALLLIVHPALADTALEEFGKATILPKTDIITIIARLIRAFLGILGIIFVILIIYAGFLYMTSGGDPAKTGKAKKLIQQSVIGFVIIMTSFTIVSFVLNALLKASSSQITSKSPVQTYTEPLASSLGAGILESHYPPRNAKDIPRNTKIFITFKEAIDPTTIIQGYNLELGELDNAQSKLLNDANIWIFESDVELDQAKKPKKMLASNQVIVVTNPTHTIFVFDPVDLLGSPTQDTNYSVALQPTIKKADGETAFKGVDSKGYGWTFEVSTEVDLIPPKVTRVEPDHLSTVDKNATVEITFNEAMDPVSSTGSYINAKPPDQQLPFFTNISILNSEKKNVEGTFEISNAYRTVGFTTTDPCGKDPCGDIIYCLPGSQKLDVTAKAATIDITNPPQAKLNGVSYDGLTDAAGNSLDGSGDGIACGSSEDTIACALNAQNDDYQWSFNTTANLNTTVPQVISSNPVIKAQEIDQNAPLLISFNIPLKSISVNTTNVSVWPDPLYKSKNKTSVPMWFSAHLGASSSIVELDHQSFVSNAQGGWDYYPVVTHGIKGNNQICMYPATQKDGLCNGADQNKRYCCNGEPSKDACVTEKEGGVLPGNKK
jgi:hypothetical protein